MTQYRSDIRSQRSSRKPKSRSTVELSIAVVGAVAIALWGLLIEQLVLWLRALVLPWLSSEVAPTQDASLTFIELVLAASFSWALWWLLAKRQTLGRAKGTQYYVRALPPSASDWHMQTAMEKAASEEMHDVRVIQRTVALDPTDDVHDVVREVAQINRDLEMTMNEDDPQTGFRVVPNMVWPLAMGVGAELNVWEASRLDEINEASQERDFKLDLSPKDRARASRPFDDPRFTTSWMKEPKGHPSTILVTAELTDDMMHILQGGEVSKTTLWRRAQGFDAVLRVESKEPAHRSANKPRVVFSDDDGYPMALYLAETLLGLIHDHPHASISLAARMPKTVGVALGWLISDRGRIPRRGAEDPHHPTVRGPGRCWRRACHDPWSVLIPLNWDPATRDVTPVRLRDSQPSVEAMRALMRQPPSVFTIPFPQQDEIVNLTPHDITLYAEGSPVLTWSRPPANHPIPRVKTVTSPSTPLREKGVAIPTQRTAYDKVVEHLPEPQPGRVLIVSQITASSAQRSDLVYPLEYREDGRIVGCTGFGRFIAPD